MFVLQMINSPNNHHVNICPIQEFGSMVAFNDIFDLLMDLQN
jgi:hypothetical protein